MFLNGTYRLVLNTDPIDDIVFFQKTKTQADLCLYKF